MLFRRFVFSLVSFLTAQLTFALGPEPDLFFKPGPTAPLELPNDLLYPKGRLFLFSFTSLGGTVDGSTHTSLPEPEVQAQFELYKKNGLKIFGPQHEMNKRILDDAAAHDLKSVYMLWYGSGKPLEAGVKVDPEDVYRVISHQVKEAAHHRSIVLWYLQPAEIRPWRKNDMEVLEAASRAIRDSDPLKRPLWSYSPAHANAKRMASIAPWVDYLSKGLYTNYAGMQKNRIWGRWTIEQEIEAIRTAGSDAVPFASIEMYHDARRPPMTEQEIAMVPTWVRHDTYLALISGAKGVIVFSLRQRPSLPPAAWQAYYGAYMRVAGEVVGEKQLGQIFLFGETRSDVTVDIVEGPAELEMVFPVGGVKEPLKYASVSHLNVAYGADRYLFLVNSAEEKVKVMIGNLPYASTRAQNIFDEKDAVEVGEGEFEEELKPLEVKGYRLSRK